MVSYIDFFADGKDGTVDFEKLMDVKKGIKRKKSKKSYKFESKLNKNCKINDFDIYIDAKHFGKQEWSAEWIKKIEDTSGIFFFVIARKKNKNKEKSVQALDKLYKISDEIGIQTTGFLEQYNTSYDPVTKKQIHYPYTKMEVKNLILKAFGKSVGIAFVDVPVDKSTNYIQLGNLNVNEKFQNQCIGSAILEKVMKLADDNCLDVYIEANPMVSIEKKEQAWKKLENLYSKYAEPIEKPEGFHSLEDSKWFKRENKCNIK